jgi:hypothetical protein
MPTDCLPLTTWQSTPWDHATALVYNHLIDTQRYIQEYG